MKTPSLRPFLAGGAVGLILGGGVIYWAVPHGRERVSSSPETSPERAPIGLPATGTDAPGPSPVSPHPLPPDAHAAVDTASPQIAKLRARIDELDRQLASAKADLASNTAPLTPPDALPERFSQSALVAAATSALRESGSKAELSTVDCTEYPCIVYFRGLSTQADVDALKRTAAYQPYASDHSYTLGRSGPDGPYDAMVEIPRSDPHPRNEMGDRLKFRLGQMLP